eukprot:TRINITY_DN1381_c0_g1_i1.p1 TRINITY_DN1381_c0_g1~~TRINITY_DN1381_c0_g1_i1.p1  ORF type:complete len:1050 (+),score=221.53 TRINITY_DN1381_c0_g1_i1:54-3203(+)
MLKEMTRRPLFLSCVLFLSFLLSSTHAFVAHALVAHVGPVDSSLGAAPQNDTIYMIPVGEIGPEQPSVRSMTGESVFITGERALVSAPKDTVDGEGNAGRAFIYKQTGKNENGTYIWSLEAILQPPVAEGYARFSEGGGVLLDDECFICAEAYGPKGSVFVFRRSGENWEFHQQLTIEGGGYVPFFGSRVDYDDGVLIVGSYGHDCGIPFSMAGMIFTFAKNASGYWEQRHNISLADPASTYYIGSTFSASDGFLFVGDDYQSDVSLFRSGCVHVYARDSDDKYSYHLVKTVYPSNPESGARFGGSVASHGGNIFVSGAYSALNSRGAAYVFLRLNESESSWVEVQMLNDSSLPSNAEFGATVSINADHLIAIGAPRDMLDTYYGSPGSAYIYRPFIPIEDPSQTPNWIQEEKFWPSDNGDNDRFASSISLDGSNLIVGSPYHASDVSTNVGKIYIYTRETNECVLGTNLCSPNANCENYAAFGANSYNCTCQTGYVGNGFVCTKYVPQTQPKPTPKPSVPTPPPAANSIDEGGTATSSAAVTASVSSASSGRSGGNAIKMITMLQSIIRLVHISLPFPEWYLVFVSDLSFVSFGFKPPASLGITEESENYDDDSNLKYYAILSAGTWKDWFAVTMFWVTVINSILLLIGILWVAGCKKWSQTMRMILDDQPLSEILEKTGQKELTFRQKMVSKITYMISTLVCSAFVATLYPITISALVQLKFVGIKESWFMTLCAFLAVCVFSIGLVPSVFAVVYKNRKTLDRPRSRALFGSLFDIYVRDYALTLSFELGKTLIDAVVMIALNGYGIPQLAIISLMTLVQCVFYFWKKPIESTEKIDLILAYLNVVMDMGQLIACWFIAYDVHDSDRVESVCIFLLYFQIISIIISTVLSIVQMVHEIVRSIPRLIRRANFKSFLKRSKSRKSMNDVERKGPVFGPALLPMHSQVNQARDDDSSDASSCHDDDDNDSVRMEEARGLFMKRGPAFRSGPLNPLNPFGHAHVPLIPLYAPGAPRAPQIIPPLVRNPSQPALERPINPFVEFSYKNHPFR